MRGPPRVWACGELALSAGPEIWRPGLGWRRVFGESALTVEALVLAEPTEDGET